MEKKYNPWNYTIILLFLIILVWSCSVPQKKLKLIYPESILINQVGYDTQATKIALIRIDASEFVIKDTIGNEVLTGKIRDWKSWDLSGDSVRVADFSELIQPGEYYLVISDTIYSSPIKIKKQPYEQISRAALKAFYYNRSAMDIDKLYGKEWARLGGHPDTIVYAHQSTACKQKPQGTILSSSGGWYDAGDYNKYIVNSGITTYTLMLSYSLNSAYHQKQDVNIPESGNSIADILDETLYNLRWMQTMQDPADGGVYHKLTTKAFAEFVMPNQATANRYVVKKSTAAALDFAATMAYAFRVFNKVESQQNLAKEFLKGAQFAWRWAKNNPEIYYTNPSDISTGQYDDKSINDEWFWAASELYLATADKKYLKTIHENYQAPNTPKWDVVNTLGIISLLTSNKANEFNHFSTEYIAFVNKLVEEGSKAAYKISLNEMAWGSNSDVANQGMLKMVAYHLTSEDKYQKSAQNDLDYLLGRNATGYCFVTGFGHLSPMNIHHRPSAADSIKNPVPGFLVGGPNTIVLSDCGSEVKRSTFPAKSYTDSQCSYSTNEIAINWNAPFVMLTSSLNAYVKNK